MSPPFCQLLTLLKPLSSSLSPPTSSSSKLPFWGGGALHSCVRSSTSIINLVLVYLGIGSTSHGSKLKILARVISPFPVSSPRLSLLTDHPWHQLLMSLFRTHCLCTQANACVCFFLFFHKSHHPTQTLLPFAVSFISVGCSISVPKELTHSLLTLYSILLYGCILI